MYIVGEVEWRRKGAVQSCPMKSKRNSREHKKSLTCRTKAIVTLYYWRWIRAGRAPQTPVTQSIVNFFFLLAPACLRYHQRSECLLTSISIEKNHLLIEKGNQISNASLKELKRRISNQAPGSKNTTINFISATQGIIISAQYKVLFRRDDKF